MAKVTPIAEQFQHFVSAEREFLGRPAGAGATKHASAV
jgi:hypothetical protein